MGAPAVTGGATVTDGPGETGAHGGQLGANGGHPDANGAGGAETVSLAGLDLDLDVFQGPFDLLITLVLKEEIDLLEVDLADIVVAYVDRLEARGELDLEAATEFLLLIAALLELKSRLMLPAGDEEPELAPAEAADELLARMLEYHRHRGAAAWLSARIDAERGYRYRSAPPPAHLRRALLDSATQRYEPALLGPAIEGLLRTPPPLDVSHLGKPTVSVRQQAEHLRRLIESRGRITFDEAVEGTDRVAEAVTLFALLHMYKHGEADWRQEETFGPITVTAAGKE